MYKENTQTDRVKFTFIIFVEYLSIFILRKTLVVEKPAENIIMYYKYKKT